MALTRKQKKENAERAERGAHLIGSYIIKHSLELSGNDQTNLTDMLADLMHLAYTQREAEDCPMDFDDALRVARGHFEAELKGKDWL